MKQIKKSVMGDTLRKMIAALLCLALISTTFGIQAPVTLKAADSISIVENFDDYADTTSLLGGGMGSPTFTLVKSGDGQALQVSDRTQNWMGYCYDLSAYAGNTISVKAKIAAVEAEKDAETSFNATLNIGEEYKWVANATVKGTEAGTMECAEFVVDAGAGKYVLYFEGPENVSYIIDDIEIKVVGDYVDPSIAANAAAAAVTDPSFTEDFNDAADTGALKGGPMGSPTLTIVDKALQVSDRTQNWMGYSYNLSAFAGNTISLKAKIAAVGVEKDTETSFNATLNIGEEYKWVANATVMGTEAGVMECAEFVVDAGAGNYTLYFEGPENVSYIIDDISVSIVGEYKNPAGSGEKTYADPSEYPKLKDLYKDYFSMGMSCEAISNFGNPELEIGNEVKENFIASQFNSVTFGNELKPAYNMGYNSKDATETYLPFVINPSAKEMLDWAKANNMPVRGHTLVWHSQCNDEVFCKNYKPVKADDGSLDPSCLVDRDTMLKRLESYIYSAMEYIYKNGYGEVIYAWDVVNEAIEPGYNEYDMRNSYWYQTIGADFIYYSFKFAREASVKFAKEYKVDATPLLFYNDFNENTPQKRDAIIRMATTDFAGHNIKAEGYIDGFGLQGHVSDNTDVSAYIESLEMYGKALDNIQITELDVSQTSTGANAEYYQAKFYKEFFTALTKVKANLTNVTIWGLTDATSWKAEAKPLIFNGDLSKKLAFDALVSVIDGTELPEPAFVAPDFKDLYDDFEGDAETIENFKVRDGGAGTLSIQSDVVYDGEQALQITGRGDTWHGISFDVSRFVGQTIEIKAWVKSDAPEVKLSANIDGTWPNISAVDTSDGKWKQICGKYKIPANLGGLSLYFETTTGTDDIFVDNVSIKLRGQRESFEEDVNIANPRGVAHMPVCTVTDEFSHSKSGHSYLVTRSEKDAGMKFDVSKYIGYTVRVKAYVKTKDAKIRMGIDGEAPVQLAEVKSNNGWKKISATYTLSNELTSAQMYIETDGKADFYVDDIVINIANQKENFEGDTAASFFAPRWGGAGTVSVVKDGKKGNHAAVLTERTETYMGLSFDVSPYLGMEVEISMDVKTDDDTIMMTGDITDLWPQYLSVPSKKGKYKHIKTRVKLPSDLSTLRAYVETDGKSDLYIDNVKIRKIVDYKVQ